MFSVSYRTKSVLIEQNKEEHTLILTQKRKHTQLMVMTKILHGKDKLTKLTKLTFSYLFWIQIFRRDFCYKTKLETTYSTCTVYQSVTVFCVYTCIYKYTPLKIIG